MPGSSVSYDPESSSWRTSQRSFDGEWTVFSGTWPRSGMMRSGIASPQPPSAPLTSVTGCSSWPTPTVVPSRPNEGNMRILRARVLAGDLSLGDARAMLSGKSPFEAQGNLLRWPAPRASENVQGLQARERMARGESSWRAQGRGATLSTAVAAAERFPTPTSQALHVRNSRDNWKGLEAYVKDQEAAKRLQGDLEGWLRNPADSPTIKGVVEQTMRHAGEAFPVSGSLNPAWTEWLMGFPIGWTDCAALETPSSPRLPNTSGASS